MSSDGSGIEGMQRDHNRSYFFTMILPPKIELPRTWEILGQWYGFYIEKGNT